MKRSGWVLILAGLALWPAEAVTAQSRYTLQPLVKAGDPIGALEIPAIGGNFGVLGLANTGRLDFFAWTHPDPNDPQTALIEDDAGQFTVLYREGDPLAALPSPAFDVPAADVNSSGQVVFTLVDSNQKRTFVQYSAGALRVIASEGGAAPGGQWQSLDILGPHMMNQRGDMVFDGQVAGSNGSLVSGVFRWDGGAQRVVPVATNGSKAGNSVTLDLIFPFGEAINNPGEITFTAGGEDGGGNLAAGLFLADPSGAVRPVALDNQPLPGGDAIGSVTGAVLDDSGVITFQALRKSDVAEGVFQWRQGTMVATGAVGGAAAPGGGTFEKIDDVWINPRDGSLLVAAELANNPSGVRGLYRFVAGQLSAAVVPGQMMPDGATNAGPRNEDWQISPFNAAGQVAFITSLADGSTAAYLMSADGKLALLLKEGVSTSLGTVSHVGPEITPTQLARFPVGLNDQGQVALPVAFVAGGPVSDAILLLTPQ